MPRNDWFVTPTEAADFLKIDAQGELDKVTECLEAALEWAEGQVGDLTGAAVAYRVNPSGNALVLPVTHLERVIQVQNPDGDLVEPVSVDALSGIVYLPTYQRTPGLWQVIAQARSHGESVRLAVKIVASHLYTLHRGRATGMMPGVKPVGEDPALPRGFAIPKRALDLIAPFKKPKGF